VTNPRERIVLLAVAGAVALVGGRLHAQETSDEVDPVDVTVPMEKQAELSPQQMSDKADELIGGMRDSLKRLADLRALAKRQQDVIKLNCVNDKTLQVKQLLNIAENARTNLAEAVAQEDEAARYHEFGKIVISEQQVRVLSGEADACVGEELIFLGPTDVDAEEPEFADDPAETDDSGDFDIEDPGYASPYTGS